MLKYIAPIRREKRFGDMDFPGFSTFDLTPPLMHAMFTLRDAIPDGCTSITVEFDEQGAAFITARRDGHDVADVTLSEEGMSAAGLLLTYLSYQVITLTRMHEAQGEHAVYEAQCRLVASLGTVGLAVGLLDETITDSIRVYR